MVMNTFVRRELVLKLEREREGLNMGFWGREKAGEVRIERDGESRRWRERESACKLCLSP